MDKISFSFGLLIVMLANFISCSMSFNIAFLHGISSHSHRVALWPLAERLADIGHKITYISPLLAKDMLHPNVTEILPTRMAKSNHKFVSFDVNVRLQGKLGEWMKSAFYMGHIICEDFFKSSETKAWLKTNPKIDLMIIDTCYSECYLGLAYKFQAQIIYFSPIVSEKLLESFGVSYETSSIPEMRYHFGTPLNFFGRLIGTVQQALSKYHRAQYMLDLGKLIRKNLNVPQMPELDVIEKNVSLVLTNGYFIEDYPRSLPPIFVNVAGMHCKGKVKSLPNELERFIQSGEPVNGSRTQECQKNEGFIYISFGSAVAVSQFPQKLQNKIFNVIQSKSNLRFIWKWNGERPSIIPRNLFLSDWFPQQDILGHSRIRGFIFQGGRPSTQEAIFHAVPMIVLPVFADQDFNANRIESIGAGISLEIGALTEQKLFDAVSSLTTLKENLKRLSSAFKKRPIKPLDLALWWTEYILENNPSEMLKPMSVNQPYYQRKLLDVWIFLLVILIGICIPILYVFHRYCLQFLKHILFYVIFYFSKISSKNHQNQD